MTPPAREATASFQSQGHRWRCRRPRVTHVRHAPPPHDSAHSTLSPMTTPAREATASFQSQGHRWRCRRPRVTHVRHVPPPHDSAHSTLSPMTTPAREAAASFRRTRQRTRGQRRVLRRQLTTWLRCHVRESSLGKCPFDSARLRRHKYLTGAVNAVRLPHYWLLHAKSAGCGKKSSLTTTAARGQSSDVT